MRNPVDARLLWVIRYFFYKFIFGRLSGIGYLGKPCFLKGIGRFYAESGLGVFPGARIEILNGKVVLGKNVRIGQNLLLNCGSLVEIGDDVTISANVFIGTTDFKPNSNLGHSFKDWPEIERHVIIGNGCFIGFGAVILPGTHLHDGCVVGANAVVRGTFEKGSIIASEKAKCIKKRD